VLDNMHGKKRRSIPEECFVDVIALECTALTSGATELVCATLDSGTTLGAADVLGSGAALGASDVLGCGISTWGASTSMPWPAQMLSKVLRTFSWSSKGQALITHGVSMAFRASDFLQAHAKSVISQPTEVTPLARQV
jgi:hypothetical protein